MAVKEYWDTVYVTANKVMNMNSAQAAQLKKIQHSGTYNKHLVQVMTDGCIYLTKLTKQLNDISKKYDQFEVELPFIHFTDKNVRYVQGAGRVVRAHIRGGRWISYR